jgi:hypothetical protein
MNETDYESICKYLEFGYRFFTEWPRFFLRRDMPDDLGQIEA